MSMKSLEEEILEIIRHYEPVIHFRGGEEMLAEKIVEHLKKKGVVKDEQDIR
jgi:hypothetical protein